MSKPRQRVLLSAFACEPGRGSEQEVGWRWALELAKYVDVTVLTQTRNQAGIERALASSQVGVDRLCFEYYQLATPIYWLKSHYDFLTFAYYAIWQWYAMKHARKIHEENAFDLVHHLTFASFRVPIWMKKLGLPVIFGPVGGAESAAWQLLGYRARPLTWLREALRNVMTSFSVKLMKISPPVDRGRGLCLAATPKMLSLFQQQGLPSLLFPTIGADGTICEKPEASHVGYCRFLYVGRLHVLKGVQFLLEAFFRASLPGATLTVVGNGPEAQRLKAQAMELGLGASVQWLGELPRESLPEVYAEHDVLVAPSMYESGGMVVLEAMQSGLPCIVLDVGGHAVSVTEDCGIKVPAGGPVAAVIEGLKSALEVYANDLGVRAAHGAAALVRVRDEYGWDAKARRMLEIYANVALPQTQDARREI